MTNGIAQTGPLKLTSGDLTFFEVRVLGLFIGAFSRFELALGAEADAIMNMVVEELFEGDDETIRDADVERFFQATWRGHVRYVALTSTGWTDVVESKEDLIAHLSAKGPGM